MKLLLKEASKKVLNCDIVWPQLGVIIPFTSSPKGFFFHFISILHRNEMKIETFWKLCKWNNNKKNMEARRLQEATCLVYRIYNLIPGMEGMGYCSIFIFTLGYLGKKFFWSKLKSVRMYQIYYCDNCMWSEKGHHKTNFTNKQNNTKLKRQVYLYIALLIGIFRFSGVWTINYIHVYVYEFGENSSA